MYFLSCCPFWKTALPTYMETETKGESWIIDLQAAKSSLENIKNKVTEFSQILRVLPRLTVFYIISAFLAKERSRYLISCCKTDFSFSCFNPLVLSITWRIKFILLLNSLFVHFMVIKGKMVSICFWEFPSMLYTVRKLTPVEVNFIFFPNILLGITPTAS